MSESSLKGFTCTQDGSREVLLSVHCSCLEAIFLRRTLCDIAHYCKLVIDEARHLWPPASKSQEAVHANTGTQSLSCMKATIINPSPNPHAVNIGRTLLLQHVTVTSLLGKSAASDVRETGTCSIVKDLCESHRKQFACCHCVPSFTLLTTFKALAEEDSSCA